MTSLISNGGKARFAVGLNSLFDGGRNDVVRHDLGNHQKDAMCWEAQNT
jgi:hypothetical protein